MVSDNDDENRNDEQNESQYYLYVHIMPSNLGKSRNEIIPSSAIKKFNYNTYKEDINIYKNKKFTIRLHPEHGKEKGFILYAGNSYSKVMKAAKQKRFSIPNYNFSESINDSSHTENAEVEEDALENYDKMVDDREQENRRNILKASKKGQKAISKVKTKNTNTNYDKIINQYLNSSQEEDTSKSFDASTALRHSHHLRHGDNTHNNKNIVINELQKNLRDARAEVGGLKKTHDQNCDNNRVCNTAFCNNTDPFKVHDKIYGYNKEQQEEELSYDNDGNVHLGSGVYCNPLAFNDSFKTKNPSKCLALLSEGVYGLSELSKRCVRKQKNTKHLQLLSPIKRMVIEKKVYTFMRIKNKAISQVDDFLDNLNIEHRKVINNAIVRLDFTKKQNQIEAEIIPELPETPTRE